MSSTVSLASPNTKKRKDNPLAEPSYKPSSSAPPTKKRALLQAGNSNTPSPSPEEVSSVYPKTEQYFMDVEKQLAPKDPPTAEQLNKIMAEVIKEIDILLTGGTIVGHVGKDGYKAGSLSAEGQRDLIKENLRPDEIGKKLLAIKAHIQRGGSQNLKIADVADTLEQALKKTDSKTAPLLRNMLLIGGTDRLNVLHSLISAFFQNDNFASVGAMCPPGGAKEGYGSYQDGPVNLKNTLLLWATAIHYEKPIQAMVMEYSAYNSNADKVKTKGIQGAFQPRDGHPLARLIPKDPSKINDDAYLDAHAGDPEHFEWKFDWKQIAEYSKPLAQLDEKSLEVFGDLFKKMRSNAYDPNLTFEEMEAKKEPDLFKILYDGMQNNLYADAIKAFKDSDVVVSLGSGGANTREDQLPRAIEEAIMNTNNRFSTGKVLIRHTPVASGKISDSHSESTEAPIFKDLSKYGLPKDTPAFNLTQFTIPSFCASPIVSGAMLGMLNAAGISPPKKADNQSAEEFLADYMKYTMKIKGILSKEANFATVITDALKGKDISKG